MEYLDSFCLSGLEVRGSWGTTDASLPVYKQGKKRGVPVVLCNVGQTKYEPDMTHSTAENSNLIKFGKELHGMSKSVKTK